MYVHMFAYMYVNIIWLFMFIQAINVGMLVAVTMDKYKDRSLIGRVQEISGDSLVLEWMAGSYSASEAN